MRGRRPKDPAVRQRTNIVSTRATLPTAQAIAAPPLPERPADNGWHVLVVEWWKDIWASPQATRWTATEKHQAYIVATLLDEFYRAPNVRLAAELRTWEAGLGLDEMDRRRLQWEMPIAPPEAAPARRTRTAAAEKKAATPARSEDPRKRFRIVS